MEERLMELAQGIDEWLVGDWVFKADRNERPCPACIEALYIYLAGIMPAKEAEQRAIFLVIKGVYDGQTYEQIASEGGGAKTGA